MEELVIKKFLILLIVCLLILNTSAISAIAAAELNQLNTIENSFMFKPSIGENTKPKGSLNENRITKNCFTFARPKLQEEKTFYFFEIFHFVF